jgi:voltage-gated potassium channel
MTLPGPAWRGTRFRVLALTSFSASGVASIVGYFALTYWCMGRAEPSAFSEHLSKVDAAYFAVTTFTTTGFGDIHAISGWARAVITAEMVTSVVILIVVIALTLHRALSPGTASDSQTK